MDDAKMHHKDSYSNGSTSPPLYGETEEQSMSIGKRFLDSFKRAPNARAVPKAAIRTDGRIYDVESAAAATAESPLARRLKGRHLQMIAIGGSIGMTG
jgi:yeast amino acid transporter